MKMSGREAGSGFMPRIIDFERSWVMILCFRATPSGRFCK